MHNKNVKVEIKLLKVRFDPAVLKTSIGLHAKQRKR